MKVISFIFLLISLLLTACDPSDSRLKFVNRSSRPVIAEISNDSINFKFNNVSYYKSNVVLKDSILVFHKMGSHHAMTDYIEHNPHKKLYLVIFSVDSINKYQNHSDLSNLFMKKKYLNLRGYSEQELIDNNWVILY
jgi:hypothetical protein